MPRQLRGRQRSATRQARGWGRVQGRGGGREVGVGWGGRGRVLRGGGGGGRMRARALASALTLLLSPVPQCASCTPPSTCTIPCQAMQTCARDQREDSAPF